MCCRRRYTVEPPVRPETTRLLVSYAKWRLNYSPSDGSTAAADRLPPTARSGPVKKKDEAKEKRPTIVSGPGALVKHSQSAVTW